MSSDTQQLARHRDRTAGFSIVGTPAEVTDVVAAYQQAGADELIIPDSNLGTTSERTDTCDRFIEEVAVHFRATAHG
jgi:alkanesulfonate monooxygenase SsuD/methylene tetrahydromethanopterin reductase-like flavin-dependent oxidoreductase (luciferase family)